VSTGLDIAVPPSWSWAPLKFATTFLNRGFAPDYVDAGPIRAISQAANQLAGLDWTRTRFSAYDGDPRRLKGYLLNGDTLINSTGNGTLGRVGYFTQGPDDMPCVADGHVTVARADRQIVEPRYLYYWLGSALFHNFIYSALVVGATNQIELNREGLAGAPIALPPLDEQQRIADFLDAETTQIDQLDTLQRSVLAKLNQRDRAVRDSLIDRLANTVGDLPLRRYSSKIEQGSSPTCESHPRDPGEWGVLKLSAVKQGRFYPDENKQLPADIEPMREYEVHDGDLLVTRANTPELVGDAAVASSAGERLLLPDLIYRVGLNQKISAEFVAQVLLSSRVRSLIQATARGSSQSMVKLRGEDIKEWPVPRANAEQQAEVVATINDQLLASDKLRSTIDRQLELLAERRRTLITAAVTGGIPV
jgi:type I restriction enzyme, S subunit